MNSLWGFIKKEIRQTLRDPRMAVLLFAVPIIQLILFGYAISNEVKNIRIGFWQNPADQSTREIAAHARASGLFLVREETSSLQLARGELEALFVTTPRGLSYEEGRSTGKAQLLLDGTDLLRAQSAERYLFSMINVASNTSFDVKTLYNPTLNSAYQMIPGVVCMIVAIFTIVLTSMSITKERERGTLEMLLVSPVSSSQIIAGKSIPYFLIGLINIIITISVGIMVFKVPFRGPILMYFMGAAFFLVATLGVGILISTLAKNQQQAMMGGFIFLFPAILLSGLMTPICNMPEFLQTISLLNPMRYFVNIARNVLLKGGSSLVFWNNLTGLICIAITLFPAAIYRFKKTLV